MDILSEITERGLLEEVQYLMTTYQMTFDKAAKKALLRDEESLLGSEWEMDMDAKRTEI